VSKLPVIGRQLDRCDVCGKKVHKINLVRTNVDFLSPTGNNYVKYSSYSSGGWSYGTTVDAGAISIGTYADRSRVVIGDDNTTTESFGSQTWTGAGRVYATGDAVDLSSWSSLVLAADVGPYERNTDHALTVVLGTQDSNDGNRQVLSTWTISNATRVWVYKTPSDITFPTNFNAYIEVTPNTAGQKWWFDRVQLEKNATKMGTFIPTSGSSIDQTDSRSMIMRKVCKSCYEPLLSRTNQYNREAEDRTDEPISVWMQEV
jgi:hypothetical protein